MNVACNAILLTSCRDVKILMCPVLLRGDHPTVAGHESGLLMSYCLSSSSVFVDLASFQSPLLMTYLLSELCQGRNSSLGVKRWEKIALNLPA